MNRKRLSCRAHQGVLLSVSCIESLEPRRLFSTLTPAAFSNDPKFLDQSQTNLFRIGAPRAWDITTGSNRTVVAVIDSGIDYRHPDLAANIWINQKEIPYAIGGANGLYEDPFDDDTIITFHDLNLKNNQGKFINNRFLPDWNGNGIIDAGDILSDWRWENGKDNDRNGRVDDLVGWDFADNDNDPLDLDGHGTHMAGIIGAAGNNSRGMTGIAWRAQLMPVKIFRDLEPDEGDADNDAVIAQGIRYAVDSGARISNNSYGGPGNTPGDVLYQAIQYAQSKNHLFVTSSGNSGLDNDTDPDAEYPASFALPNILTIAGARPDHSLAAFSNYGKTTVDLAAPGTNILSTARGGGYYLESGTSMAAAHGAGAAALLLAKNPNLSAAQMKYMLLTFADKTPSLAGKLLTGGRLNIARALAATPLP
jgi:subtilisin family serine protease